MPAKGGHNSHQLHSQCKLPGSNYPEGSFTERNQWEMLVTAKVWKRRKETIPLALCKPVETENNQREISQRALPPQTHLFTTSLYPGACFSDTGFRNGLLNLQGQGQRMFSACPCTKDSTGTRSRAGLSPQPALCQLCRKQYLGSATLSRGNQYAVFSPALQQAAVPKAKSWRDRPASGKGGQGLVTQELGLRAVCSGHGDPALFSHVPVTGYHPPDGQEPFFEDQVLEGVIPARLQPVE